MQCLPGSLLQEVQQQGAVEAQAGDGGAGSQDTQSTSKRVANKIEVSPSSPTPFSSHAQSLSLALEPIQQRAATNSARNRDGQKPTTLSSPSKRRSSPGERPAAWWLPSSPATTAQLVGSSDQTSINKSNRLLFNASAVELSEFDMPETASTNSSNESKASSIAYITQNRRQDFRLLKKPIDPAQQRALAELEKDILREAKVSRKNTPTIVEDSMDYITAKLPARSKNDRLNPGTESVSLTPASLGDWSVSTASSNVAVFPKSPPHPGRSSGSSERGSPSKPESPSSSTLRLKRRRPVLSRFLTSNDILHDSSIGPPTQMRSSTSSPTPLETPIAARRQSAPLSPASSIPSPTTTMLHEPDMAPRPSFHPDEQYFEEITFREQRKFTPSPTPDRMSLPTALQSGHTSVHKAASPLVSLSSRRSTANPSKRKARYCFGVC